MVSTGSTTEELEVPADEYVGAAVVSVEPESTGASPVEVDVEVRLRGHFEPLDGLFHWYGRVAENAELAEQVRSGTTVLLTTSAGAATGRLSDVDPWGRFRVSGTGRPPF